MERKPVDVSIIIVSFNTKEHTRKCIECVRAFASGVSNEVFVVDNASRDGSADMIASEFKWARLIRLTENRGFAGGNNVAMKLAAGRYTLLLNSDAFLAENVLSDTVKYMDQNKKIGVLGCKLTNPDGSLQPSARMLPCPLNKLLHITGLASHFPKSHFFGRVDFSWWDHSTPKSVGWVVGAFFLIKRETMKEIGFLDELYFLYFEEIDYCLNARRSGWDVVFYPYAQVVHLGGQSTISSHSQVTSKGKQMLSIRITSEFRYYRKWYGMFSLLVSAFIELGWNMLVFTRNLLRFSSDAVYKREEASTVIRMIITILLKDRMGKGRR